MMRFAIPLVCLAAVVMGHPTPVSAVERFGDAERSPMIAFVAMSGKPGEAEAVEILASLRAAGFSQMVPYPRSGLELEYMGEDWLAFVGAILREARRTGMKVWLYDEYNWPSGSCRGRVPAENPAWRYTEYVVRRKPDGSFDWRVERKDTFSMYDKYFDVNAYSEEAIRRFIELTHEVYEKRFGDYFKDGTIRGIFTDEPAHPSVMKWTGEQPVVHFRWYAELEDQYRAQTGRDFRADVEAALRDPSKDAVWKTYTELKGRQFRRAYFDQTARWAKRVGIETCGHMIGEGDPRKACDWNGLPLETLRGLTLPGIDIINANLQENIEWLTYATEQYAIEHNRSHGGIELYACGPCDLTVEQMVQRLWVAALHGMDTYFTSLYHTTARGFHEKGGHCMFFSPTQPYFLHAKDLHAAAKEAAGWSRKRFVRDVAVRYPQRLFGRLAIDGHKAAPSDPPLVDLVRAFSWHQVPFELLQEDEPSACGHVFAFRGTEIAEERSGRVFASPQDVLAFLEARPSKTWRVRDAAGKTVPGLLVRNYEDGTGVVLNMHDKYFWDIALNRVELVEKVRSFENLVLERPDGSRERFDVPARGRVLFAPKAPRWTRRPVLGDVTTPFWQVACDRDSLRRIWFPSNRVTRLTVAAPLKGVRWVLRDYPKGVVSVTVNGRPIAPDRPASSPVPFAYAEVYRETAPFDLAPGTYELTISGLGDNNLYLPALWLAGQLSAEEPTTVLPRRTEIARLGPLSKTGFADFAGTVSYSATVDVPADVRALALDTDGLVADVTLGDVALGEKGVGPWEWSVPPSCRGKRLPLVVRLTTSVMPVLGRPPSRWGSKTTVPDVKIDYSLGTTPNWNLEQGGLRSVKWLGAGTGEELLPVRLGSVETGAPFWNQTARRRDL